MPKKSKHVVSNDMVVFAFRYALGRQTAAVSIVVNEITKLWPELSQFDRSQIKREIIQAMKTGDAGDACDVRQWETLLNLTVGKPPWKA